MKLSREFSDEQQALARELALQALGYRAWRNRKGDATWQVFWLVPLERAENPAGRDAATLYHSLDVSASQNTPKPVD